MDPNNAITPKVTNPNQASGSNTFRFLTGGAHFVTMGVLGVSSFVYGIPKSVISTIALAIHIFRYVHFHTTHDYKFNTLNNKFFIDMNGLPDGSNLSKENTLIHKKFKNSVQELAAHGRDIDDAIKETVKSLFAGVITSIPVVGIVGSALFLRLFHSTEETGIHALVEITYREIARDFTKFSETLSPVQKFIFPLNWQDHNAYNREKLKNLEKYKNIISDSSLSDQVKKTEINKLKRLNFKDDLLNDPLNKNRSDTVEFIPIPVYRGDSLNHELDAVFVVDKKEEKIDPDQPLIVLFHGNCSTLYDMQEQINFYRNAGVNVLAVTMGGYPDSDEKTITSEVSAYQDANAVICELKSRGFKNISVHGTSIGSTLAFAAAELHPEVVKRIITNVNLGEIKNTAANSLKNEISLVPTSIIRGIVSGSIPKGVRVPGVKDAEGNDYKTDGLSNTRKAKAFYERNKKISYESKKCKLFTIGATKDNLMGRNLGEKKISYGYGVFNSVFFKQKEVDMYTENFADDLNLDFYGENKNKNLIYLIGDHNASWNTEENKLQLDPLKKFLKSSDREYKETLDKNKKVLDKN